jgi:predicted RecA/RadA family phage recombinase
MAETARDWLTRAQPGRIDGDLDFPPEWRVVYKDPAATVTVGQALALEPGILFVMLSAGVSGEIIPMATSGIWELDKVDAAVIAAGEYVQWDESVDEVDDDAAIPATGDFNCGLAMETKGATTGETIAVAINAGEQPTVT